MRGIHGLLTVGLAVGEFLLRGKKRDVHLRGLPFQFVAGGNGKVVVDLLGVVPGLREFFRRILCLRHLGGQWSLPSHHTPPAPRQAIAAPPKGRHAVSPTRRTGLLNFACTTSMESLLAATASFALANASFACWAAVSAESAAFWSAAKILDCLVGIGLCLRGGVGERLVARLFVGEGLRGPGGIRQLRHGGLFLLHVPLDGFLVALRGVVRGQRMRKVGV